jgi:predicted transcriptional regulator
MVAEVKRITLRVAPELHSRLSRLAVDRDISLNTLAINALETYSRAEKEMPQRLPLQELSELLAPAAEAAGLTEDELLRHARAVRKRIWVERYEQAVRAATEQATSDEFPAAGIS